VWLASSLANAALCVCVCVCVLNGHHDVAASDLHVDKDLDLHGVQPNCSADRSVIGLRQSTINSYAQTQRRTCDLHTAYRTCEL